MKKVQRARNLFDDLTRFSLGEVNPFLNSVQQLAAVDLLEYEVELLLVLEELDQLYDVRVALAMVERLDFLEHPGTRVPGDLVDDLHGVFEIRVQGCTGLDRGVSTFPENFSGQLIQFCNSGIKLFTHSSIGSIGKKKGENREKSALDDFILYFLRIFTRLFCCCGNFFHLTLGDEFRNALSKIIATRNTATYDSANVPIYNGFTAVNQCDIHLAWYCVVLRTRDRRQLYIHRITSHCHFDKRERENSTLNRSEASNGDSFSFARRSVLFLTLLSMNGYPDTKATLNV